MNLEKVISSLGEDWKYKWFNRRQFIESKHAEITKYLPEYVKGNKRVLDISCGNGLMLEIMRHYGNDIMGTEIPTCALFPLLESQDVPCTRLNSDNIPYPFADKSYDLVSCVGSIHGYKTDWNLVLDEFFRIASECVFVIANHGEALEKNKHILRDYCPDGWIKLEGDDSRHKWVKRG